MSGWWRAGGVAVVAIAAGLLFTPSPPVQAQTPVNLLFDDGPEVAAVRPHYASKRSRRVGLNRALLQALAEGHARSVRLNLFQGAMVDADVLRSEWKGNTLAWAGRIRGESGTVHLTTVGNAVAGRVESKQGIFAISMDADGTPKLDELDPSRFPDDMRDERMPAFPGVAADVAAPPKSADDGSQIDVLFLYTTTAKTNAGGTAAIQAVINNAINVTNTAYANSGVVQRINVVGPGAPGAITAIELVGYAQSGDIGTDLDNITGQPATAISPTVLGYRNTYGADLVQLVADYGATASCGIGWLNPNSAANEVYGYSVAERLCADGNLTTPHEMGHNQGLKHGHEEAGSDSSGYGVIAYGFKAPDHSFRTIMAYDCATGASCPRVGRFSNPLAAFNYNGQASGVAGTGTSAADNVSALNGSRVTASNWRTHRATPTATTAGTATSTSRPRATSTSTPRPRPTSSPTATATSTPVPVTSFYTVPPCRVVDTRNAAGPYGAPALFANADRVFTIGGVCGISATAKAVSLNMTITQPTVPGDLRMFPAGQAVPLTSVINFGTSQTRANNAIITLNPSGQLAVRDDQPAGATVQFILDVNGYFE